MQVKNVTRGDLGEQTVTSAQAREVGTEREGPVYIFTRASLRADEIWRAADGAAYRAFCRD